MGSTQFIYEYVKSRLKTIKGTQQEIDQARDVTLRDEAIRIWNQIEDLKLKAIRGIKIL